MILSLIRYLVTLTVLCTLGLAVRGQDKTSACISGYVSMDDTWASTIYLSYIPTFEEMYAVSNEMIIARTGIDSLGYFRFDIDFLPRGENLYRLHLVKKGDTPASLIIGGKDENHLFLIADRSSIIRMNCHSTYPPFKQVHFESSKENMAFQKVSDLVFVADSLAAESSASKRLLVEKQLLKDLHAVADTSANLLVSLYAIYKSKFESNYPAHAGFYQSYLRKWKGQDNAYFDAFSKKMPGEAGKPIYILIFLALIVVVISLVPVVRRFRKSHGIEKLSIQERKIYELLQQGASNQEISNHFNIGLSTVKSHVSSIYSKLNVKSRKHIMNVK
jgi:DNA-binding CsgD family transcriptional regulator